tara:strand:- start:26197 stop:26694 length:498 start_codon:yes stop_codon:yes gene_type:complete
MSVKHYQDIWPETTEEKITLLNAAIATFRTYEKDSVAGEPPVFTVHTSSATLSNTFAVYGPQPFVLIVYKPYLSKIALRYFIRFDKELENEGSITHSLLLDAEQMYTIRSSYFQHHYPDRFSVLGKEYKKLSFPDNSSPIPPVCIVSHDFPFTDEAWDLVEQGEE